MKKSAALLFSLLGLGSIHLFAWQAPVTLVDEGTICDGNARLIGIDVDMTGMVFVFGDAGLNAFVVTLDLSRNDVQVGVRAGTSPSLDWKIRKTDGNLIALTSQVTIVGWVADTQAPNTNYRVCELIVSGGGGSLTLTLNTDQTSFATRSMGTTPAGTVPFTTPPPLTVAISNQTSPPLGSIVEAWLTDSPEFDVVTPSGLIDVADLTQLINCGSS